MEVLTHSPVILEIELTCNIYPNIFRLTDTNSIASGSNWIPYVHKNDNLLVVIPLIWLQQRGSLVKHTKQMPGHCGGEPERVFADWQGNTIDSNYSKVGNKW